MSLTSKLHDEIMALLANVRAQEEETKATSDPGWLADQIVGTVLKLSPDSEVQAALIARDDAINLVETLRIQIAQHETAPPQLVTVGSEEDFARVPERSVLTHRQMIAYTPAMLVGSYLLMGDDSKSLNTPANLLELSGGEPWTILRYGE